MKEVVELAKKIDLLQTKMKVLETGFIPLEPKKFKQILEISLKDLFRDEEKISLLREIKLLGISFAIIIILLLLFVIFLCLFTIPVEAVI